MENQYCRVGTITPMSNERLAVTLLEYQYQNFMEKASDIKNANTALGEFFENKAQQFKKILENLVP
jgi:putative alpha-1,2-mannosidase